MKGEHVKCITRWLFFVLRLNKISQELQIWITTWNRVGKLWLMMVLLSSSSQTYYLELVLHQLLETYKTIDIGACGVAVGYPLDTVKVRIQTQKQFTGIWQCVVTTVKKEGAHGFFKGMALPVTTISMTSSVVFGTYRNCLQCFSQLHGIGAPNSKIDIFLSGMAGGVAQISVMSPGDIVKVRLQCQTERKSSGFSHAKPKYSGPIHCLLTIAKEEGVLGLYRGALPLAFRDGPSYATYFLTYNTMCSQLTPAGQKEPEWTAVLLAGGVAGMAGWSVGTPMDVIKARLQMDGVREEKRFRGLVHCLTETVRHEGPGIFFKSLGINCLRAFPVNMVVFAVYEVSVRVLRSAPLDQLS